MTKSADLAFGQLLFAQTLSELPILKKVWNPDFSKQERNHSLPFPGILFSEFPSIVLMFLRGPNDHLSNRNDSEEPSCS